MALILTPGQLARRSDFYHQMAQLNAAGLDLLRSLRHIEAHPPDRSYRPKLASLLQELSQGYLFTESLRRVGNWLPEFDLALLMAGEHSGRLDACFRVLAEYYTDRARMARQVIADMAYPVFLFHFAIAVFGLVKFFQSTSLIVPLLQALAILAPIYALTGFFIIAGQSSHGETWRSLVERVLSGVPVVGNARRSLAIARLSGALEALLNAGVTIIEAWEMAATASGSPALKRIVASWRPALQQGETPAQTVRQSGYFPEMFTSQYDSGEISGKLDETLRRLHAYYQEEGFRKMHFISQWVPRALYLIVAGLIGWWVIRFYVGYFNQIAHPGGF
jgi:type IV pilus assembly protein PilC